MSRTIKTHPAVKLSRAQVQEALALRGSNAARPHGKTHKATRSNDRRRAIAESRQS